MTIQKVTRAKPETEEVPSGHTGYIVLKKHSNGWDVVMSPFKDAPVYSGIQTAIESAEDGEFIVEITLPRVEEDRRDSKDALLLTPAENPNLLRPVRE